MSAWHVYWLMQADEIKFLLGVISWILLFPTVGAAIICCFAGHSEALGDDEDSARVRKVTWAFCKCWGPWLIVSSLVCSFMPDTKTLAAMYVVPAVVNNETLTADLSEVYTLGMEKLKGVIGDTEEEGPQDD